MAAKEFESRFTPEVLKGIFPAERADEFFEALFGDPAEGAYDLQLAFTGYQPAEKKLQFEIQLKERPGKCLACNLTYGLPQVFSRHPVIDIKGLVKEIEQTLGNGFKAAHWSLEQTRTVSRRLHVIPLSITLGG